MTAVPSHDLLTEWTTEARTRDGVPFCIRPLRPDDRERETAFINSLSPESRYFRLLTPLRVLSPHLLDQLMDVDYHHRMALVATVRRDGIEHIVGVARYGEMEGADAVELGITVTDEWQRQGIARLLVLQLMRFAQQQGIRRFEGIVLPENHRMLALAKSLGFGSTYVPAENLVRISRPLES